MSTRVVLTTQVQRLDAHPIPMCSTAAGEQFSRCSFDPQAAGNSAGLNIEEPERWGELHSGTGYDLRGASTVSFDVRSPNGAMVLFGIGGCNSKQFTPAISSTWTRMSLTLDTSDLTCTPDLSDVHILFAIATNDVHAANGATVLLDNIQFAPVPTSHQQALGFPLGNQTFGVLPQQDAPIPADQVVRNLSTTYEIRDHRTWFAGKGRLAGSF